MPSKFLNEVCYGTVISDQKNTYRCCGIRYKRWVLTSGLILCSCISPEDVHLSNQCWNFSSENNNDWNSSSNNFISALKKQLVNKRFKILLDDTSLNGTRLSGKNNKTSIGLLNLNSNQDEVFKLNSSTAQVLTLFRSNLINQYVVDNFSDWQLCTSQEQYDDISSDLFQNLLSVFLILQIGDNEEISDYNVPLNYFSKLSSSACSVYRGQEIIVESTPFAVPQFYNSWSKGIISNKIGQSDSLFFTDTRLVIGCVGAPVYRYRQGHKDRLLGMILNPMLWNQGEWAGFSVAINLNVILTETLTQETSLPRDLTPKDLIISKLAEILDKSVVLVRWNHNWGSGVIVNKKLGIIITCAHVVNYKKTEMVLIECGDYKTKAEVVFTSKTGDLFDVAVLQTKPLTHLKELALVSHPPVKGETVYCVGFPMVDTERVTISKGIIANIVPDVCIQTTCCVQSGASGGAIINSYGGLVGIPTSNMSCAASRALFPHCNLAVPATLFTDLLVQYFATNDISCISNSKSWPRQQTCKL